MIFYGNIDILAETDVNGVSEASELKFIIGNMTMTEVERIADQLTRAFNGPAWHGPSLQEIVSNVGASLAAVKEAGMVHSIWEILAHIIVWVRIGRLRIDGEETQRDIDPKDDWPCIEDTSDEAWKQTLSTFHQESDLLVRHCLRLTDAELSTIVRGAEYSYYFILHGVVQHTLYHAGQIALLKSSRKGN